MIEIESHDENCSVSSILSYSIFCEFHYDHEEQSDSKRARADKLGFFKIRKRILFFWNFLFLLFFSSVVTRVSVRFCPFRGDDDKDVDPSSFSSSFRRLTAFLFPCLVLIAIISFFPSPSLSWTYSWLLSPLDSIKKRKDCVATEVLIPSLQDGFFLHGFAFRIVGFHIASFRFRLVLSALSCRI